MATRTIIVETRVPEDIYHTLLAHGVFRKELAEQPRRLLALHFYQDRTLSLGKAARLAGLGRWEFIDFLSDNQMPVLDHREGELAAEFDSINKIREERRE